MRCVVCGAAIVAGHEQYANAWETCLKQHPCCGVTCAGRFSIDEHWIPWDRPVPLPEEEEGRLLVVARERIQAGEHAHVVVREMLTAGMPPSLAQKLIFEADVARARAERAHAGRAVLNVLGIAAAFLFGQGKLAAGEEPACPEESIKRAEHDLALWRARHADPQS